ncbi:MAG: dihydrodipicolinate reductase [bacterium]|nr:dihydrodipicolinate reductase [bacterium]
MARIVHVGLGPLGRKLLADFRDRDMGHVVGVVDVSPDLVGKTLEEVVPGVADDVRIVSSIEELGDLEHVACALVTTSSDLEACRETFLALLDKRVNVISSCEELSYPWLRHPVLAQELHERALRSSRRILGTGINPGFLLDTLPVVISGVCRQVRSIEAARIQDARPRRIPFQRKIGAGLDERAFAEKQAAGTLRHVGLGESLHFVADAMGWKLDRWEETLEPVLAETDLECDLGPIPAGHAAGVRQVAEGWVGDERPVRLEFVAAIGQKDPRDSVRIEGEPPIELVIPGGVHGDVATTSVMLNAIDSLRAAEPGLHTMATIAPPHWRVNGAQ